MRTKERPWANDSLMPAAERAMVVDRLRLGVDKLASHAGDYPPLRNPARLMEASNAES